MAYSRKYIPDYPQITFGDGELIYDEQLDKVRRLLDHHDEMLGRI